MSSKAHKQEAHESRPQDHRPAAAEGEYARGQEMRVSKQLPGGIAMWNPPGEVDEALLAIPASSAGRDWGWFMRHWPFVQSQNKALEKNLEEMRQRLERRDTEIVQLREKLSERKREVADLKGEAGALKAEVGDLKTEAGDLRREVADLKMTLSMYDECSEVDITSLMKEINTRIQSLTRNTAQRWLRGYSGGSEGGGNTFINEEEIEAVKRTIGPQLANALGSPPPERGRCLVVLLPLAWQASTVTVVAWILWSFVEGLPASAEGQAVDIELRKLSALVKQGEIQPAYGRWRFITHQYMKRRVHHEEAVQLYVREALRYCRLAARLALKSACPDDQTFLDAFQAQLTEIMEEAFKLRAIIQERMLTANYDPYLPANGDAFRDDIMEVPREDEKHSKDIVVCATRLGLISSRKRERENSSELMKELSLRAQVLTDRNLRDIVAS